MAKHCKLNRVNVLPELSQTMPLKAVNLPKSLGHQPSHNLLYLKDPASTRQPRLRAVYATESQSSHQTLMKQSVSLEQQLEQQREQRQQACLLVGQILQKSRLAQGIALTQIAAATKISPHRIQKLEMGQFDEPHEDTYLRCFILHLSKALGLDGHRLVQQIAQPIYQPVTVKALPQEPFFHFSRLNLTIRPLHLYWSYILLILGAISGLSWFQAQHQLAVLWEAPPDAPLPESDQAARETVTPISVKIAPPEFSALTESAG